MYTLDEHINIYVLLYIGFHIKGHNCGYIVIYYQNFGKYISLHIYVGHYITKVKAHLGCSTMYFICSFVGCHCRQTYVY